MCGWKPVLIFSKGNKKTRSPAYDVLTSEQSESGVESLIKIFSKPGELIVDPFAGNGDFGIASQKLGRRFIGAEIDPNDSEAAKLRIDNTVENSSVAHEPCIKRLMQEGVTGSYRGEAMAEVAKSFYRLELSREVASRAVLECNSRNVPPLPEQEISDMVYSVYTNGYTDIACGKKLLKEYCDEAECRALRL